MKKTMVALQNFTYNTRRLKAGDEFLVSTTDARILAAIRRAELKPDALVQATAAPFVPPPPPIVPPAPPAPVEPDPEPVDDDDNPLKAVRAEYEQIVGKRPFHGWDETELRRRIAEHSES